jgi:hypothetical protein
MRASLLLLLTVLSAAGANAATVRTEHGNIVVDGRVLTKSGRDSAPVPSPDGKRIVFDRGGSALKDCSFDGSPSTAYELWSIASDGSDPRRLLRVRLDRKPENTICSFDNKQFSSNGRLLYFETGAWATSGAIHVLDLTTGRERFLLPGGGLTVLNGCRDRKYRDDLIVSQHRYFLFGGSFDWAFLFTPQGKEVGPLGDGDFTQNVADACG